MLFAAAYFLLAALVYCGYWQADRINLFKTSFNVRVFWAVCWPFWIILALYYLVKKNF